MPVSPELIAAYENADYVVFADPVARAAAGYPSYAGEGRDPDGRCGAEPSLLVIGVYRANAEALGRLFGQNAIVFVEKGAAPELVVLG